MTKRALIIGISDQRPHARLETAPGVSAICGLLERLGGWSVDVLTGQSARREAMLDALERLVASTEAGDDVLFYFFGHGGVVCFSDAPGPLGQRPVFYISASRTQHERGRAGVLDQELGRYLARAEAICGSVSVILDCCHSGMTARGDVSEEPAPAWVHALERVDDPPLIGDDSHPTIVRLAATSSLHSAFAHDVPRGSDIAQLGWLTELVVSAFAEVDDAPERLTWDHLAHWARERAMQMRPGYEHQWVSVTGPRERLVFSAESVPLPRTVGFIPDADGQAGWLRAGWLNGLKPGEPWAVLGLGLDADRQPIELAALEVTRCELNRARAERIDSSAPADLSRGCCAHPLRPPTATANPVGALRPGSRPGAVIAVDPRGLETRELDEAQARALIGDWGRAQTLTRVLDEHPDAARQPPLQIRWWRRGDDHRSTELEPRGEVLRPRQRVVFEFRHLRKTPERWYVSAIEIDAAGRPILLNASEPDGREVGPQLPAYVGCRSLRDHEGIALRWPSVLAAERPRPVSVIVLMSLRPIVLGHLVDVRELLRAAPPTEIRPRATTRGVDPSPPELSGKWAWARIDYSLAPA